MGSSALRAEVLWALFTSSSRTLAPPTRGSVHEVLHSVLPERGMSLLASHRGHNPKTPNCAALRYCDLMSEGHRPSSAHGRSNSGSKSALRLRPQAEGPEACSTRSVRTRSAPRSKSVPKTETRRMESRLIRFDGARLSSIRRLGRCGHFG